MRLLPFAAALLFALPAVAADLATLPVTASGHAHAETRRAMREDGLLSVELRFLTDYAGYSGEEIYTSTDGVYVEAGGQRYPLAPDEEGHLQAPEHLELKFNYDPEKNPRVGSWKGTFTAPPAEVTEAVLILPNLAPVPLTIKDR